MHNNKKYNVLIEVSYNKYIKVKQKKIQLGFK